MESNIWDEFKGKQYPFGVNFARPRLENYYPLELKPITHLIIFHLHASPFLPFSSPPRRVNMQLCRRDHVDVLTVITKHSRCPSALEGMSSWEVKERLQEESQISRGSLPPARAVSSLPKPLNLREINCSYPLAVCLWYIHSQCDRNMRPQLYWLLSPKSVW